MKKIWSVILVLPLLLCGCDRKPAAVSPVLSGIGFTAEICCRGICYTCDCTVESTGDLALCVREPEELCDSSFTFCGETVKVDYKGLSKTIPTGDFPENSAAAILYRLLQTAGKARAKGKENFTGQGTLNGDSYALVCSPTGLPLSASVPAKDFSVEFRGIEIIK